MAYVPKTWNTGRSGGTPITANDLNHIEQGIVDAESSGGTAVTVDGSPVSTLNIDSTPVTAASIGADAAGAATAAQTAAIGAAAGLAIVFGV